MEAIAAMGSRAADLDKWAEGLHDMMEATLDGTSELENGALRHAVCMDALSGHSLHVRTTAEDVSGIADPRVADEKAMRGFFVHSHSARSLVDPRFPAGRANDANAIPDGIPYVAPNAMAQQRQDPDTHGCAVEKRRMFPSTGKQEGDARAPGAAGAGRGAGEAGEAMIGGRMVDMSVADYLTGVTGGAWSAPNVLGKRTFDEATMLRTVNNTRNAYLMPGEMGHETVARIREGVFRVAHVSASTAIMMQRMLHAMRAHVPNKCPRQSGIDMFFLPPSADPAHDAVKSGAAIGTTPVPPPPPLPRKGGAKFAKTIAKASRARETAMRAAIDEMKKQPHISPWRVAPNGLGSGFSLNFASPDSINVAASNGRIATIISEFAFGTARPCQICRHASYCSPECETQDLWAALGAVAAAAATAAATAAIPTRSVFAAASARAVCATTASQAISGLPEGDSGKAWLNEVGGVMESTTAPIWLNPVWLNDDQGKQPSAMEQTYRYYALPIAAGQHGGVAFKRHACMHTVGVQGKKSHGAALNAATQLCTTDGACVCCMPNNANRPTLHSHARSDRKGGNSADEA
jgi:hypothetical protein